GEPHLPRQSRRAPRSGGRGSSHGARVRRLDVLARAELAATASRAAGEGRRHAPARRGPLREAGADARGHDRVSVDAAPCDADAQGSRGNERSRRLPGITRTTFAIAIRTHRLTAARPPPNATATSQTAERDIAVRPGTRCGTAS